MNTFRNLYFLVTPKLYNWMLKYCYFTNSGSYWTIFEFEINTTKRYCKQLILVVLSGKNGPNYLWVLKILIYYEFFGILLNITSECTQCESVIFNEIEFIPKDLETVEKKIKHSCSLTRTHTHSLTQIARKSVHHA